MRKILSGVCMASLFFMLSPVLSAVAEVGVGSSREEIIAAFGEPSGQMDYGSSVLLVYPGDNIVELVGGKVVYISGDFKENMEQGKRELAFQEKQKKKGFVLYDGKWVTKKEKAMTKAEKASRRAAAKDKKLGSGVRQIEIIKGAGAIGLSSILVPGKVTVIDFYADWCGPCKRISPYLEGMVRKDPDLVLRKIDIVKWGSPVATKYNIRSIPSIRVYNRKGKMVGSPTSSLEDVQKYVKRAK